MKKLRHKYFENRFSFVACLPDGLRWEVTSTPQAVTSADHLLAEMEKYCGELREMLARKAASQV